MSFRMFGPGGITLMPNPDLDNEESIRADVSIRQSMNSTFYTYVRQSNNRRVEYTWSNLGRGKIAEIEQFFALNFGEVITITDHRNVQYRVTVEGATLDFATNSRTFNSGGPRKESGSTTLSFVGVRS